MNDDEVQKVRWLKPGSTARQVYDLPRSIPWPELAPPPSLEDIFLNLAALQEALEIESTAPRWSDIAVMCQCCETASSLMENFEYTKALEELDEAEQSHPCAFVHWQRCICHLELGHPEQALAAAYHATSMAPRCAVFWRVFGELCQDRGMSVEAAQAFERAFHGGDRAPSVIAGMKTSGLLVPNPAHQGEMLVSPAVARAILEVHIKSIHSRANSLPRLRELASASLSSDTTSDVALEATTVLMSTSSPSMSDLAMHGLALWANGDMQGAAAITLQILGSPASDISTIPEPLARLVRRATPEKIASATLLLHSAGVLNKSVAEELYSPADPSSFSRLESLLSSPACPPQMVALAASRMVKSNPRRSRSLCSEALVLPDSTIETRLSVARTLLELGEYEKSAATASNVPVSARGSWGQFLLAECLWQLDQPALSLDILEGIEPDADEALTQNISMRIAQCRGDLLPLGVTASISPTGRLVRPILVSGDAWTSVVAPSGLSSSSYIRVQVDRVASPGEYQVAEFSRSAGQNQLGSFRVAARHNMLALAIGPDGLLFVGARNGEKWVPVTVEDHG